MTRGDQPASGSSPAAPASTIAEALDLAERTGARTVYVDAGRNLELQHARPEVVRVVGAYAATAAPAIADVPATSGAGWETRPATAFPRPETRAAAAAAAAGQGPEIPPETP